MGKAISSKRLLQGLLVAELVLVFFQLGIRFFIDTTFVRDICLILSIAVVMFSPKKSYRADAISSITWWLIGYGVLVCLVHSFTGSTVQGAVLQFRNFFLPLLIVPLYRELLMDFSFRIRILRLAFILLVVLLVDIYIEYILSLIGISRDILPWYPYQYTHLYRFTTAPDAIPSAIAPEMSPILGIQGWPLQTSATLVGLFSFILPASFSNDAYIKGLSKVPSSFKYFFIILVAGALIILQVKTSILAYLIIVFLFFISSKSIDKKTVFFIIVLFVVAAYLSRGLWGEVFAVFSDEMNEGELEFLLDSRTIENVTSAFFSSSIINILFGGDFSSVALFENLEIRIIVFTLELGIVWLLLFAILCARCFSLCNRFSKKGNLLSVDRCLLEGIKYALLGYVIDMLHYANLMYLFNIFFFAVMTAMLSAYKIQYKND